METNFKYLKLQSEKSFQTIGKMSRSFATKLAFKPNNRRQRQVLTKQLSENRSSVNVNHLKLKCRVFEVSLQ